MSGSNNCLSLLACVQGRALIEAEIIPLMVKQSGVLAVDGLAMLA